MKFYLVIIPDDGNPEPEVWGPYDDAAERDAQARCHRRERGEGVTLLALCGEVIGPLEVRGYTAMDMF